MRRIIPLGKSSWRGRARILAFSLVELLAVVAVIGILVALLLPSLSRTKAAARKAVCQSNLRQIGVALRIYTDDFSKYPLYGRISAENNDFRGSWDLTLLTYVGLTPGVFDCPAQPGLRWAGAEEEIHPYHGRQNFSYAYNSVGTLLGDTGLQDQRRWVLGLGFLEEPDLPVPESRVVAPSDMIAIGDGLRQYIFGFGVWTTDVDPRPWRHPDLGSNAVFCDGHVEGFKAKRPVLKNPAHGRPFSWGFFLDEAHARRFNNDNQPHPESWQRP